MKIIMWMSIIFGALAVVVAAFTGVQSWRSMNVDTPSVEFGNLLPAKDVGKGCASHLLNLTQCFRYLTAGTANDTLITKRCCSSLTIILLNKRSGCLCHFIDNPYLFAIKIKAKRIDQLITACTGLEPAPYLKSVICARIKEFPPFRSDPFKMTVGIVAVAIVGATSIVDNFVKLYRWWNRRQCSTGR